MTLVLERKQLLRRDFDEGEQLITQMVLAAVALPASVSVTAAGEKKPP